jgi:SpoVK/Ycf46/Vps4 family AAA+-type ATPase
MKKPFVKEISIKNLPNLYHEEAAAHIGIEQEKLFLEVSSYRDAISHNVPFLLLKGNKGSGKTALLKQIAYKYPEQVIGIVYTDFYEKIVKLVKDRYPNDSSATLNYLFFDAEWTIQLWCQVIKQLYRKHLADRRFPADIGDYEVLFDFADKHGLLETLPWNRKLLQPFNLVDIHWETKDKKWTFKPAALLSTSITSPDQITTNIKNVITKLLQKTPIFIIIDEIDEAGPWNDTAKAALIGLFRAAKGLYSTVNQGASAKQKGIKIRIAIREDMLRAAVAQYVGAEKLPEEEVALSWTNDALLEMLVRPIRVEWGFAQNEIPALKLFAEIFPPLDTCEQTLQLMCRISHNNPRALVSFTKKALSNAISRQDSWQETFRNAYYEPMCMLPRDIQNAIAKFSEARLDLIVSSNVFMYPGLEIIIPEIKKNCGKYAKNKSISYRSFSNLLSKVITDNGLLSKINLWPDAKLEGKDEVLRRLYLLDFIRIIQNKQEVRDIHPDFIKAGKIIISPMYEPSFMGSTPLIKIEYEANQLYMQLEKVKAAIDQATSSLKLPAIPQEVEESYYNSQTIRYALAKVFWAIRYARKLTIAYSDNSLVSKVLASDILLKELDEANQRLAKALGISVRDSNIISILMNDPKGDCIEFTDFNAEIENDPVSFIYSQSSKGIREWEENLRKNRINRHNRYAQLTAPIEEHLQKLRAELRKQTDKLTDEIALVLASRNSEAYAE